MNADVASRGVRLQTLEPSRKLELIDKLGDALLLNLTVHRGRLVAVVFADGVFRDHDLGPIARCTDALRLLRLSATLALRDGVPLPAETRSAIELDDLLFGALPIQLADRPLVVVPVDALHALPWSALPSCLGRPVSVVPSVAMWLRTQRGQSLATSSRKDSAWIAGPGLLHAEQEVRSLRSIYGGQLLTGKAATVRQVLSVMNSVRIVHIAAHGQFRQDEPLLSHVELADRPLYGYDLHQLSEAPQWVVLSACDSARAGVRLGEEPTGFAATLLHRGATAVVASMLPVPDDRAVALVTALHKGLHHGLGPATALARAQSEHGHLGFVCLGAG